MLATHEYLTLTVAEWAIVCGVIVFVIDRLVDRLGLAKSATTLREENADLLRRSEELKVDKEELRKEVTDLHSRVAVLKSQVDDLKKRDQEAVLKALQDHEVQASKRQQTMTEVLKEIRDAIRTQP